MSQALPCSILQAPSRKKTITTSSRSCSLGINHFWLVGYLCVLLVGVVDQLFQPASNQCEPGWTSEKAFMWLCCMIVPHVRTIHMSNRISPGKGWKSVLLRNASGINPNWLQLKQLIPTENNLHVSQFKTGHQLMPDNILAQISTCRMWKCACTGRLVKKEHTCQGLPKLKNKEQKGRILYLTHFIWGHA